MTDTPTTPAGGPVAPGGRTARFLPHVLVAFSVLLFAWTIWDGRAKGLHRVIPHAIDKHETSIAVAISDLRYRLNGGYIAYRKVHNTLVTGGWTYNPYVLKTFGYKYPDNMRDHALLDHSLQAAANLPDPWGEGLMYCPIYAEDVGYVDYAKLSFRVFGVKISSLYSGYFLLMGISLAAYLLAYRRNVPMLLLLVGFQIAFFLVVRSLPLVGDYGKDPSSQLQLGSVVNGRFLCTLGLIPFLHLAGCLLTRPRPTALVLGPAVVQASWLGLALHLRGSAMWIFAALFGIVAVSGVIWVWRHRRELAGMSITLGGLARGVVARWPVALVLLALVGQKAYIGSAVHWTYHTDDGLPNHLVWHNAMIGLALHPDWGNQSLGTTGKDGDDLSVELSMQRLDREGIGRDYFITPLTRVYKPRLHDRLCGMIYRKFALTHPRYMAELMLWYKPQWLWQYAADVWGWTRPGLLRPDALCFMAVFAACLILAGREAGWAGGWRVPLTIAVAGFGGSLIPLFWAYPHPHVMSEFMIQAGLLLVFGTFALWRVGVRLVGRVVSTRVSLPAVQVPGGRTPA